MLGYHIIISVNTADSSSTKTHGIPTFTPKHIFQRLPRHKPSLPHRQNTINHGDGKDCRTGPLQIDWMDFETEATGRRQSISTGKERERRRGPVEATFVPSSRSKSGSTNLPEGIVHIFRDGGNRPAPEDLAQAASEALPESEDAGVTLGVLAVPSWMTPSDFLTFISPAVESIAHLRLIREAAPNRSMALIRFTNPADAAEFVEVYNGKPFNSMEPEICHVVHVLSVQVEPDDTLSQAISRMNSAYGPAPELPTCPVCLERMDSAVTGLITVPCSHTFHCMCLSKWGDSRCPVCRYSQNLLTSHPTSAASRSSRPPPFGPPSAGSPSTCSECPSTTNLWICLICGNIGCGRYGRAHAHAHYQATTHLYALELETQRVWDYAGDGYVHRLIQNKADGKLVELPSAAASMGTPPREGGLGPSQADALSAEKIEAIGIEYSYLLTSQLDSQRVYYEERDAELTTQLNDLKSIVERMGRDMDAQKNIKREEEKRRQEETAKRIAEIEKGKAKAEQRADRMAELAKKLDKDLKEERAVAEGLMQNIQSMKDRLESEERGKTDCLRKIEELQDQVRDLMFFLEANAKIEQGGGAEAEAAGGSIEVVPAPSANPKNKKGKKGR
ncbi:zf-UBP-domain-containing protein [Macrolepiota fuliginosa MF-IS2]|uniref:Zf-UBP-domain-containing protein n=1 Tax=Macrolepiota fuliginosa MF-IS2 TaxID=1400762 RepID=A0A9P6C9Y3_9AGAR|nr:zf-UBP-domain-containing protein [Macrolepiota fuliginosa MF-IS2]